MAVSADILRSYRAPRAVLRDRLARGPHAGREGRALVYLMIACGLIFVAQWPRLARQAHLTDEVPFEALMAGALFGWMFLAPLFFYAVGALLGLALRIVRRGTDPFAAGAVLGFAGGQPAGSGSGRACRIGGAGNSGADNGFGGGRGVSGDPCRRAARGACCR